MKFFNQFFRVDLNEIEAKFEEKFFTDFQIYTRESRGVFETAHYILARKNFRFFKQNLNEI